MRPHFIISHDPAITLICSSLVLRFGDTRKSSRETPPSHETDLGSILVVPAPCCSSSFTEAWRATGALSSPYIRVTVINPQIWHSPASSFLLGTSMIYVQDKRLGLPGGRTLAYADNGNTSSSTLILFLHGAFSVGDASRLSPILVEKNIHFIAPSLPGWGKSSPVPDPSSYPMTFASDMSALLVHLRTDAVHLKIIICGYSFGTVAAQMLYGAPASAFSFRSQISSVVLLAPHSPPHCHMDYAKDMPWQSYFLTGPLSRYIPFNIPARLARCTLVAKLKSVSEAEVFIRRSFFDCMTDRERDLYLRWREERGLNEGQFEREMAANMMRSVGQTWEGFLHIPTIYHSGWGELSPSTLVKGREDGFTPPVYLVAAKRDQTVSVNVAQWLAGHYPNATLRVVDGSHVSLILYLDDVWREILD